MQNDGRTPEKLIIFVSTNFWHSPMWTRKQRFAQFFSRKGFRVIYVNPPVFLTKGSLCFPGLKEPLPAGNPIEISSNLQVLISKIPVPFKLSPVPFFEKLRYRFHYYNIKKAIRRLGWQDLPCIHWTYHPQSVFFRGAFGEKGFVFDWVDRFDAYPGVNSKFVGQLEGRIIREADAVIATAMGLFDEANRKNPNARFISNGVDFSLFQKEGPEEGFLARHGIEKGKWKGIVAFVGGIHEWVDLALVGEAAAALPGYLFVMAGPVAVNIDKFSNINNIRFIGMIDRREVPSLLAESDVCISPFVVNRLSHYVNPLKVYEYLAAGKPVVSVPMPEISSLASVISFAGGAEEFGQAICRESAEDDGEKIKRRKEISQDFDWGRIQDKALQVIEPFFQARPQE